MRSYLIRIFVLLIVLALNGCKGCKDGSSERTSSKSVTADASEKKQSDSVLNRKHGGTLASVRMEAGVELEANEAIGSEKASDPIEKAVYLVNNDDQDEIKEFPGQYERQENADRRDKDVGTDAVVETIGENEEAESRTPNKDDEIEIDEEEEPAVQILSDKESETESLNEEEEVGDSNAIGDAHVDRGSRFIGEIPPISDANKGDLEILRQENAEKEENKNSSEVSNTEETMGEKDASQIPTGGSNVKEGYSEDQQKTDPVPIMKSDSSGIIERGVPPHTGWSMQWQFPGYNSLRRFVSSTSNMGTAAMHRFWRDSRGYLAWLEKNATLSNAIKVAILSVALGAVLVLALDWNGIDAGIVTRIKNLLSVEHKEKLLPKFFDVAKSVSQQTWNKLFGPTTHQGNGATSYIRYFGKDFEAGSPDEKAAAKLNTYLSQFNTRLGSHFGEASQFRDR